MQNSYELFIGIDVSKNKADAAIIKLYRDRSRKPKLLRKKIAFRFLTSEVDEFLSTVRKYIDDNCTHVTYAMEVTGSYSDNIYDALTSNKLEIEDVFLLEARYVQNWCKTHNRPKSDPLDAESIASIIAFEYDVKFVSKFDSSNEKGYTDLKHLVHRYYQLKKVLTQEMNRLIATCDRFFPELQYVFKPKSAAFLAILSVYPTTYDIINATKSEVFDLVFQATKHHVSMDKIDSLFDYCKDSLAPRVVSNDISSLILNQVSSVYHLRADLHEFEKLVKATASQFVLFDILQSMPGCGAITAATVIAETCDIKRFSSADNFVSYAGLAPVNKRSGSSVEVLGKISKKGSKFLRHALFMIAEFARRHNPILKHFFEIKKNGNKKRHRLAVVAVANKVARYIYSVMKHNSEFIILDSDLSRLPEDTRNSFFHNISFNIPKNNRKQVYRFCDCNGKISEFVYNSKDINEE